MLLTPMPWAQRVWALLSTDLNHAPAHLLNWVIQRWSMEVAFEEARAHLGLETQRQCNDQAIARSTPALLSLYSSMTLVAHLLIEKGASRVRSAAW